MVRPHGAKGGPGRRGKKFPPHTRPSPGMQEDTACVHGARTTRRAQNGSALSEHVRQNGRFTIQKTGEHRATGSFSAQAEVSPLAASRSGSRKLVAQHGSADGHGIRSKGQPFTLGVSI